MNLKTTFALALTLALLLVAIPATGQTALNATTLSAAITSSQTQFRIASATGVTATSTAMTIDNELVFVNAISGTTVSVTRGYGGTRARAHVSGAMVLVGPPNAFYNTDLSGACTNGQGAFLYSPAVTTNTGYNTSQVRQWLCSTVTGAVVVGFGNTIQPASPTTAVASAAGLITPSGPLFHITGSAAITGFTIPVGFDPKAGGQICAIPDGAFTTTTANNIGIASTGVVGKTLCWTYDANTAKFYPSY